jgi:branched-chain amino acid transport system substrate-binding protein
MLVAATACQGPPDDGSGPIRIGAIFDLSGITADIGTPWSEGVRAYFQWLDEQGGIADRPVELLYQDYAYKVDQAEQLYSQFVQEGVMAFIGWGTGDTEALRGRVADDRIPFISASFSAVLGDPSQAPYNFLTGTTYTDQFNILLDHWYEQPDAPRTVGVLHMPTPAGVSPLLQGGTDYAEAMGLDLLVEEMPRGSTDYSAELTRIYEAGARHVIVNHTASAAALLLRNAHDLGLEVDFACMNYCTNEIVPALAGEAAEGLIGSMIFSPPGEGVDGLDDAKAFLEARGESLADKGLLFGQGWAMASLLMEGVKRAAAIGPLSGEAIKQQLEALRDFDTGGVTTPVTFTAGDHGGVKGMRIFQVEQGAWRPLTGQLTPRRAAR